MKTLILVAVAFVLATISVRAASHDEVITVGGSKDKQVFVFKAKKFVGATVEVYASNGELITTQSLEKRKMLIDFGPAMRDTYTIRVVKGNDAKEYQYTRK